MASRKLAIVTGGNKGIGYAICKQLLQTQRFNVLLATRNVDNGAKAMDNLKRDIPDLDNSSVNMLELDVSKPESISASLDYVQHVMKYSTLDVLVNNAGIASGDEFNHDLVQRVFATNFYGAINCTSAYLPMMRHGGRVLMMSSRVGAISKLGNKDTQTELNSEDLTYDRLYELMGQFITDLSSMEKEGMADSEGNLSKEDVKAKGWWNSAYGMSKLGLSQYSRILARNEQDVFVGSYCPGFVATDMTAAYGKNIPLGPDDGARGMMMLADPASEDKYPTGKFWALNKSTDEDLSPVDYVSCRIPRERKKKEN